MESIFERMLRGEEPAIFLAQDEEHAAILEPCPAAPGHAVVFPKRRTDALLDMTPEALARLMFFAQKVGRALKQAVSCDKVAVISYGLKVRHVHLHLIPANGTPGEISLDKPRSAVAFADLEASAQNIRSLL